MTRKLAQGELVHATGRGHDREQVVLIVAVQYALGDLVAWHVRGERGLIGRHRVLVRDGLVAHVTLAQERRDGVRQIHKTSSPPSEARPRRAPRSTLKKAPEMCEIANR